MGIKRFEDINSWERAKGLTVNIYNTFNESKDFGFKGQIERASVSIMNNIAEGFERMSNKEFKHFLYIAKGSCGELRSMLHLALDLKKIDKNRFNALYNESVEISRMIAGLIKTL